MLTRIKKAIKILIGWREKPAVISISENDRIQAERVKPWFADNGDKTLRVDYDLNENSLVFDVGGYKGEFAATIHCKYNCHIYIFEPLHSYYYTICSKFSHNPKVKVFHYGLSGRDETLQITFSDDASSVYGNGPGEKIDLKGIVNFMDQHEIRSIDLLKLNIEGGEYELLESLIESNTVQLVNNIQVQFHDFLFEGAKERMHAIQKDLSRTHYRTYHYEFVWENWKRKE